MRISSLFPAIVTAVTAAGFALTDAAPLAIDAPADTEVARLASPTSASRGPATMLLAAFDPLSLAPRAYEAQTH